MEDRERDRDREGYKHIEHTDRCTLFLTQKNNSWNKR